MSPGDIVEHRRFVGTRWVIDRIRDDGLIDIVRPNGGGFTGHPTTSGDLTLITPAPIFTPGAIFMLNGVEHEVIEDRGAEVELLVGQSRFPLRGGGHLKIPAGNTATVAKANLVLLDI